MYQFLVTTYSTHQQLLEEIMLMLPPLPSSLSLPLAQPTKENQSKLVSTLLGGIHTYDMYFSLNLKIIFVLS